MGQSLPTGQLMLTDKGVNPSRSRSYYTKTSRNYKYFHRLKPGREVCEDFRLAKSDKKSKFAFSQVKI
jgi:hypothetical protein